MIKENLMTVEQKIVEACERSNRKRSDVTLVAVSKTKPVSDLLEVMQEGIVDFGENKVQEICDKQAIITQPLNWHMIGHLQRNKVKQVVDRVCMIHSVDSDRLARQIDQEAQNASIICPILLEVNVAREESKFGFKPEEVYPFIVEASKYRNIQINGLMTIAPFVTNAEDNRVIFRELNKLYIDIKLKNIDNVYMRVLSMGMTGDYEVAIEEGATLIRVGTGIFGERKYRQE